MVMQEDEPPLGKLEFQFFQESISVVLAVKISDVKQEYQLQEWSKKKPCLALSDDKARHAVDSECRPLCVGASIADDVPCRITLRALNGSTLPRLYRSSLGNWRVMCRDSPPAGYWPISAECAVPVLLQKFRHPVSIRKVSEQEQYPEIPDRFFWSTGF